MSLEQYSEYLQGRRWTGNVYRKVFLYPRLSRYLRGRTIDIGSGIGDMLAFRPNTIGVDINPHLVRLCQQRGLDASLIQPDGTLPHPDASFDSALLDNVIEHLENPASLLTEIRRVLRPGGLLLVGVPGERGFAADNDHKRFYSYSDLVRTVEAAGFRERSAFTMPLFRNAALSRHLRRYCEYVQFTAEG